MKLFNNPALNKGFTLVELMIVVAIIAVIAAFAVPSFTEQAKRGKRAEGRAFLMDIAASQELFFTEYSSYSGLVSGAGGCSGSACGLNYSSSSSPKSYYTAAIAVLPASCAPGGTSPCTQYTITVTPTFDDAKCTSLTLAHTGIEGNTGTEDTATCWR